MRCSINDLPHIILFERRQWRGLFELFYVVIQDIPCRQEQPAFDKCQEYSIHLYNYNGIRFTDYAHYAIKHQNISKKILFSDFSHRKIFGFGRFLFKHEWFTQFFSSIQWRVLKISIIHASKYSEENVIHPCMFGFDMDAWCDQSSILIHMQYACEWLAYTLLYIFQLTIVWITYNGDRCPTLVPFSKVMGCLK